MDTTDSTDTTDTTDTTETVLTLLTLMVLLILLTPLTLLTLLTTRNTSQGSLTCSGRSADFDPSGPADFLSAQSHTELRITDLQNYRIFEHTWDDN